MAVQLTEKNIREFAESWVAALDGHAEPEEIRRYLVDSGLEMTFPEGVFRAPAPPENGRRNQHRERQQDEGLKAAFRSQPLDFGPHPIAVANHR